MRELKKQDRTISRRPTDTERKYNLGQIKLTKEELDKLKSELVVDKHLSATSPNAIANSTVTSALNNKVTREEGKGLSTNDYTTEDKEKITNLEDRVESLESGTTNVTESGWINAVINSEFEYYNEAGWCEYRKIGKVVHIRGALKPKATIPANNTMIPMFSLPSEFVPSKNEYAVCQGSVANRWLLTVSNNSNVGISRYSGSNFSEDISAGAWLVFSITYFVD